MTGLRARMVLAVVGTSLATLLAAALVLAPLLEHRLERDRIHELRDLARTIRPDLRRTSVDDHRRLLRLAIRLQRRAGGRIVVLGRDGSVLADTAPGIAAPPPVLDDVDEERAKALATPGHVVSRTRDGVAFAASVVGAGRNRVTLIIAKRLDDTHAAATVVRAALPGALGVGLGVAIALALLLSTNLLRRLRRLAVDADALATEGLGHPIAIEGRDEVATVARAMETMRARLVADEAARVAFLGTASHELRTPLAALQATLELWREDELAKGEADVTAVARADAALRQTHRLVALASELLELSRLDSGARPVVEPVELLEVAQLIAHELEARVASQDRTVRVGGEAVTAQADPAAIARILTILLDNANNYGDGPIEVDVRGRDETTAQIAVHDAGPGLDPAERERVFARFERGRAAGDAAGAGLGLPIARGLAEAMGGTLEAPGEAPLNRFVLRLPKGQQDLQDPPTRS